MLRLILPLLAVLVIATAAAVAAAGESAAETCAAEEETTFEDWRDWTPVTAKPVLSEGHGDVWVGIYVNALAEDTYMSAGAPFPVCAKIVKAKYSDATGRSVDNLTVMVKQPPGYDPENGDWWYAQFDGAGDRAWRRGKLQDCIACHEDAAATDYLFSEAVLKAAQD
jgi:hypothetical protein